MPVSASFRTFIVDQLSRVVGRVRARAMFGGVGIYAGEVFFALIADDTLYFKVDASNRADFETRGMGPFRPYGESGEVMQYYQVPDDVLEDPEALRPWAEKSIRVAEQKRPRRRRRGRGQPRLGGSGFMIRRCDERDFELIWAIINDGAQAYKGIIPADRWTEPYMSREQLQHEIADGVVFWGYAEGGTLVGVMGLQQVQDVTLIRHAYVRTSDQKRGIGAHLLSHLRTVATDPVLIGTWADAAWAIRFYERFGFKVLGPEEKNRLLKKYWTVPERQIETSVVLADSSWPEIER